MLIRYSYKDIENIDSIEVLIRDSYVVSVWLVIYLSKDIENIDSIEILIVMMR